jgi:penicillin-binding protein 2
MDRTISGLYTPGSIVKPFLALGALNEGIISPDKKILSTGSISIPNPYFPGQETVFKDWRANGWTDMREAIAVSSDVYFYTIGGGYQGQKGLGISNIEKYVRLFGIGEKTGVDMLDEKGGTVPSIEWKAKNFPGDPWRIGDTYHTAIGQYGFQVTPLEMTRAAGAIANSGTLVTPHFILGDIEKENQKKILDLKKEYFGTVQAGMRLSVTSGTASALNVPYVEAAAKTGTAQVGLAKNKINSWVMGFFPYQHPEYAFVIMMEAGPTSGGGSATSVMRQLFDWMSLNTPEYFK